VPVQKNSASIVGLGKAAEMALESDDIREHRSRTSARQAGAGVLAKVPSAFVTVTREPFARIPATLHLNTSKAKPSAAA